MLRQYGICANGSMIEKVDLQWRATKRFARCEHIIERTSVSHRAQSSPLYAFVLDVGTGTVSEHTSLHCLRFVIRTDSSDE